MVAVAILKESGVQRVLDGKIGMTFIIESFSGFENRCANVKDYRYPNDVKPYQIWTLPDGGYRLVA